MNLRYALFGGLLFALACTSPTEPETAPPAEYPELGAVVSPDGRLSLTFFLDSAQQLGYRVARDSGVVLDTSRLAFSFQGQPNWGSALERVKATTQLVDESWETLWGEDRVVANHYRELALTLKEVEAPKRTVTLRVRVYDDGFGFRYEFAEQAGVEELVITEERTEFNLTGDHTAWWIPADYDSYEYLYQETKVSEIDTANADIFDLAARAILERHAVSTPLTMKTDEGLYLSLHEANLTNYAGMTLRVEEDKRTLTSSLVPAADGTKAKVTLPFHTPWRTVQVAESPAGLMESHLMVNLNEPNVLDDVSWIKPGKYMGIWWGHHLGLTTWQPGPQAGATTEEAKRYIDFASENGFPMLLIEGWNQGWENWYQRPKVTDGFSFTKDAPNFNLREVVAYGQEKGVSIIAHHETEGSVLNYESQMDSAFRLLEELGIHAVKTGYVSSIIPEGEYHHGQWMVNHYQRVVELGAKHQVMIVAHEPIKPTGLRRTYPNMVAREGVRGSEFNAPWGGGNPPYHLTVVPFTRGLAGPIDYTPGLVQLDLADFAREVFVPTTVGYQLAEYVVVYSPVQMASDLPEHYEGERALEFIQAVPTDWEQSRVVDAEIGQYVVVARQERGSDDWFLGALTNAKGRRVTIALDFLKEGATYRAHIFRDDEDAHYITNSMDYRIETYTVSGKDTLPLNLVPGGGIAIHFEKISE